MKAEHHICINGKWYRTGEEIPQCVSAEKTVEKPKPVKRNTTRKAKGE